MNSGRWLELLYGQTNAEKMKNKNKYSVLIVAILSLTGCWTRQGETVSGTVPLTLTDSLRKLVTVDTVQIRERTSELLLNGKVAFDQDRIAPVPVPFAGVVEEVVPELGDYVRKGETLAVIRSGEAAEAEKQYVDAVQGLAVAERNQRTVEEMYASGLASEKDRLEARQRYNTAQAELSRAKEFRTLNHVEGASYRLVAPVSGFVAERNISRNMQVRADGEDAFRVCGLEDVWVVAEVYQSDIRSVGVGQPVRISILSYPDTEFTGEIDKVYNMLDAESKTMDLRVKLANREYRLKPGMFATVYVRTDNGDRRYPTVPAEALIFEGGRHYVVVAGEDGSLQIRPVELRGQTPRECYLSGGVKAGETVIGRNALLVYNQLK